MRDHNYVAEDGSRVPVSRMRTRDILDIIRVGRLKIFNRNGDDDTTEEGVMERLRIELLIRELGL